MTTITPSRTPIIISFQVPVAFVPTFTKKLFQIWQDFANEATGHDTEWDYPISLDLVAQKLTIPKHYLMQQLMQGYCSALEFSPQVNSLTFHYPV